MIILDIALVSLASLYVVSHVGALLYTMKGVNK